MFPRTTKQPIELVLRQGLISTQWRPDESRGENTQDTFVYHLDDDTHIGKDTAASLAQFIELDGDRFLLAQGILSFPHHLTPSRFCRLADAIRPADDLTRFASFTGALGTPLGGLHGEHLVVRADIEDEIGWDFADTVIEDAVLRDSILHCDIHGAQRCSIWYSYGASPATIKDLVRQRRRWIEGLCLAFNRELPLIPKVPLLYSIFTWSLAPFQFVGLALILTALGSITPLRLARGFCPYGASRWRVSFGSTSKDSK